MKYNLLGRTDLKVSALCLGSMTWGTQNTATEGHAQIDMALDHGINFIDTAEMYPTNPLSKETQGDTERIIGGWVEKSGRRDDVIIATKVTGEGYRNVRGGAPISPSTIGIALENSLRSMKPTMWICTSFTGQTAVPTCSERTGGMIRRHRTATPFSRIWQAFSNASRGIAARARSAISASRTRVPGERQWLGCPRTVNLPRVVSIQNEYSLLCRLFDTDLAELAHNEDVGLLSFSPLACGLLTGKYSPDAAPPSGSRKSITEDLGGRITPRLWPAINAYQQLAEDNNLDLAQMALAWTMKRPFMASVIFGATSLGQLENTLRCLEVSLDDDIMAQIDEIHRAHPMPF